MRIVHLSCIAPPQTGGLGEVPFLEVASLNARGVDAVLCAPDVPGLPPALPHIARVKTKWAYGNASCLDLNSIEPLLRDADIVHLHYPFYGTAGPIASWRRSKRIKRLIMTLHMDATAPGWKGTIFDLHRRWLQLRVLRAADALLVSSLDYARHSSFASLIAERPSLVTELPFGIDEKRFCPEGPRAEFHLPADAKIVVFVGGMDRAHAFKGVEILLRAIAQLPEQVCCVLGGDGPLRPSYARLAETLGIASRVRFLGRISDAEVPNVYRAADLVAAPSVSSAEAFSLVALEAQACGTPVVATELPGVRTVVEHGVTGLLVPPRDVHALATAMSQMLANSFQREEMGKAARERVLRRCMIDAHIQGLIDVYAHCRS